MELTAADLIRPAASRAARAHRPKGFTAEVNGDGPAAATVVIRYCWYDSPRFEVQAEIIMVADEVTEAIRSLGDFQITPVEYLDNHICRFRAVQTIP